MSDAQVRAVKQEPDAVRVLLRRHAPDLPARQLRLMPHYGWGGESDAWLVDERWIFLLPRTDDSARALAIQVCLLPKLAPRLPLAIPNFRYRVHDDGGACRLAGYAMIPVEPLRGEVLAALPPAVQAQLAEQLGSFLTALHNAPLQPALDCGVPPPPRELPAHWQRVYDRVRQCIFRALADDERRWVVRRFEAFLDSLRHCTYEQTLCHGDLGSDHILFDPAQGRLTGIYDFGDLCIGDPAGDLAWRREYGEEFFQQVLAVYGRTHDATLAERVTFRMDRVPLIEIGYGLEKGRPDYVAEGRQQLRLRMAVSHT